MKYEIEIPDLPEGWEPVAYRPATYGERYLLDLRPETNSFGKTNSPVLIVQEKQPRRIVLEETGEIRQSCYLLKIDDGNLILPPGREYKIADDKNETRD